MTSTRPTTHPHCKGVLLIQIGRGIRYPVSTQRIKGISHFTSARSVHADVIASRDLYQIVPLSNISRTRSRLLYASQLDHSLSRNGHSLARLIDLLSSHMRHPFFFELCTSPPPILTLSPPSNLTKASTPHSYHTFRSSVTRHILTSTSAPSGKLIGVLSGK